MLPEHSNRDPLFVRPTAPLDTQRQGHFREEEFSIVTALAARRVKPNAPTRHSLGGTWVGEARARGVDYAIRIEKKRERAYYVTGIDALDHISKVDGCDRKKASRQLAAAHVDGEARNHLRQRRPTSPRNAGVLEAGVDLTVNRDGVT